MSLRSRLLAGMAVVAIVLIGGALVITRTARSSLIDRVDEQLTSAHVENRGFGDGPPGGAQFPNTFYEGTVDATGKVTTILTPNLADAGRPLPKISAKTALAAVTATRSAAVHGRQRERLGAVARDRRAARRRIPRRNARTARPLAARRVDVDVADRAGRARSHGVDHRDPRAGHLLRAPPRAAADQADDRDRHRDRRRRSLAPRPRGRRPEPRPATSGSRSTR